MSGPIRAKIECWTILQQRNAHTHTTSRLMHFILIILIIINRIKQEKEKIKLKFLVQFYKMNKI
jgi:hypothetical protein